MTPDCTLKDLAYHINQLIIKYGEKMTVGLQSTQWTGIEPVEIDERSFNLIDKTQIANSLHYLTECDGEPQPYILIG